MRGEAEIQMGTNRLYLFAFHDKVQRLSARTEKTWISVLVCGSITVAAELLTLPCLSNSRNDAGDWTRSEQGISVLIFSVFL